MQMPAAGEAARRDGPSAGPLDMAALLIKAYELGDMINQSADAADYLYWKAQLERDEEAQELIRRFRRAKERFEECSRFGRFHPDYDEAKREAAELKRRLDECLTVRRFKEAEKAVDDMLHEIAVLIARAVSDDIKVPYGDAVRTGCGGGSCSGGCAACG
ncbi:MAG: regulator [Thermobacillus sp. ZCTH02-B1]|uniref:YlbF family regulator n=1 Tax=Thermobacillus sp. ZCTH02-B1 TaxID=1858795 RepID=UPI000B555296|nr:YlbF family regulator [Thermobacillus sp. ZCTH02-B1]OUM96449.1 MAG: regulator [Thermobacillus sp. ZCTH02-B1]